MAAIPDMMLMMTNYVEGAVPGAGWGIGDAGICQTRQAGSRSAPKLLRASCDEIEVLLAMKVLGVSLV